MAAFTGNSIVGQVVAGDGHVVSNGQHGIVNGAASAAAFGVLAPKTAITRTVGGIGTGQSFGALTLLTITIRVVGGVGSAQSFGAVTPKTAFTRTVTGLGSSQSFGVVLALNKSVVQVLGVTSAQSFGAVKIRQYAAALGIPSAALLGAPLVTPGEVRVQVGGVVTAQQFPVTLKLNQIVQIPGLPQQTGMRSVVGGVISGDGHVVGGSGLLFGFVKILPGRVTVSFATLGLGSAQRFGTPWIAFWQPLPVLGISSAQQFGKPMVYLVWVRQSICTDLDLAAITCADLDLVTVTCDTFTLVTASPTTLDLAASTAEDLDLQEAGCS